MRPEFRQALEIFAAVCQSMDDKGLTPPVLVGGAAAEFYTGSAISTGDFDTVIANQDAFEQALISHGFQRPAGAGKLTRGWYHPELGFGFEVVGSILLDGAADCSRIKIFALGSGDQFAIIPVEDLIADRMGQYDSGTAAEMLDQARILYTLSQDLDMHYMDIRIREETRGRYGISDVQDTQ